LLSPLLYFNLFDIFGHKFIFCIHLENICGGLVNSRLLKAVLILVFVIITQTTILLADEGAVDWLTEYHGEDCTHTKLNATLDSGSNIIMTGTLDDHDGPKRWVTLKVGPNGAIHWQRDMDQLGVPEYNAITTDVDGNIYVAASLYLQGTIVTHLYKLDPNGNTIWYRAMDENIKNVNDLHWRDDGYLIVTGGGSENNTWGWSVVALYDADDQAGIAWWDITVPMIGDVELGRLEFSGIDNLNRVTLAGRSHENMVDKISWIRFLENGIQDISENYIPDSWDAIYFYGSAELAADGSLYMAVGTSEISEIAFLGVYPDGSLGWNNTIPGSYHMENTCAVELLQDNPLFAYLDSDYTINLIQYTNTGAESWQSTGNTSVRSLNDQNVTSDPSGNVYYLGNSNSVAEPFTAIRFFANGDGEEWVLNFGNMDTFGSTGNRPALVGFANGSLVGASQVEGSYVEDYTFAAYRVTSVFSGSPEVSQNTPESFSLSSYPNPFNPSMTATISLPESSDLTVVVYNVVGKKVTELANGRYEAGNHKFNFDGSNLPSGLYFIKAIVPGKANQIRKVALVK
jgi:Secretion system C-terminal sorting domain